MAERFHDFDAAWAEATGEPVRLRVFGEDVELPAEQPAHLILTMETKDGQSFIDELGRMFGEERVKRWIFEKHASLEKLGELLGGVMVMYGGGDPGEALARTNRATRRARGVKKAASKRSSATGKPSKRTSNASTRST